MQLVITVSRRVLTHSQVRVLTRALQVEQPSKHNRITFGVHATVVVDSGVERNAVR